MHRYDYETVLYELKVFALFWAAVVLMYKTGIVEILLHKYAIYVLRNMVLLPVTIQALSFDVIKGSAVFSGIKVLSPSLETDPRWDTAVILEVDRIHVSFDSWTAIVCVILTLGDFSVIDTVVISGMRIYSEGYEDPVTGVMTFNVTMIGKKMRQADGNVTDQSRRDGEAKEDDSVWRSTSAHPIRLSLPIDHLRYGLKISRNFLKKVLTYISKSLPARVKADLRAVKEVGLMNATHRSIHKVIHRAKKNISRSIQSRITKIHEKVCPEGPPKPREGRMLGRHAYFEDVTVHFRRTLPITLRHLEKRPITAPPFFLPLHFEEDRIFDDVEDVANTSIANPSRTLATPLDVSKEARARTLSPVADVKSFVKGGEADTGSRPENHTHRDSSPERAKSPTSSPLANMAASAAVFQRALSSLISPLPPLPPLPFDVRGDDANHTTDHAPAVPDEEPADSIWTERSGSGSDRDTDGAHEGCDTKESSESDCESDEAGTWKEIFSPPRHRLYPHRRSSPEQEGYVREEEEEGGEGTWFISHAGAQQNASVNDTSKCNVNNTTRNNLESEKQYNQKLPDAGMKYHVRFSWEGGVPLRTLKRQFEKALLYRLLKGNAAQLVYNAFTDWNSDTTRSGRRRHDPGPPKPLPPLSRVSSASPSHLDGTAISSSAVEQARAIPETLRELVNTAVPVGGGYDSEDRHDCFVDCNPIFFA